MTAGSQAMFVVEYPCDRFCRVEVDLTRERGQVTLQQMHEKADGLHQRIHEPERAEGETEAEATADDPVAEQEASGRPAATVFLSAPGVPGREAPSAPSRDGYSSHGRSGGRRLK
jgi:hypothetical protein